MEKPMVRELDADVYDTLELSALVYGGIGKGTWWAVGGASPEGADDVPVCIMGHAEAVDRFFDVKVALADAHIGFMVNDPAVEAINKRRGRAPHSRVTWRAYTRELKITRKSS